MSTTIGTVTIPKNPSYSSVWHHERLNHKTEYAADGGRSTYDNGPSVLVGILVINMVDKTTAGSLRTYLNSTAIYGKNSFTITPPANTDLGAGDGVAISDAYFDGGDSLDGVFEFVPPGLYNIKIPYRKVV